jgi:photosystem II stability/assembly factor-like uncharacterized protein
LRLICRNVSPDIWHVVGDSGLAQSQLPESAGALQWRQTSGPDGAVINCLLSNGPKLFAGTSVSGVFRSTNQGESWTPINAGLLAPNVQSLAADGPNLFAALSQIQSIYSAVYRSTDQGESWTPVGDGLPQISRVSLLAVVGPNLFAVSDTPSGTDTPPGSAVFRSSDQGESWTQVGDGLQPGQPVSSFAAVGPKLFAAAPGGVFHSTDQGESWISVNEGLTDLRVRALAVVGEKLFAGTFGGGVFIADLKQ